jgi:hypothetical protein
MKYIHRGELNLVAIIGLNILLASVAHAGEPFFTTLCPLGFGIDLPYQADAAAVPWKLFLGGTFAQAEILNLNQFALVWCDYGGNDPSGPKLQSTGSYRLQLVRNGQSCRFVQVVGARIGQVQSNMGGTSTKFICKGTREVCIAMCD